MATSLEVRHDGSTGSCGRDPVIVVSADTHAGPLLVEQLRNYCPKALLEDFDEFAAQIPEDRLGGYMATMSNGDAESEATLQEHALPAYRWNARSAGHHEPYARLADLDYDGIACEVIFHNSINGEPLPWVAGQSIRLGRPDAAELTIEGLRMYNRWLADFCSVEPDRHVGLCQLPMWDIDTSLEEVIWAHDHGLKGVSFPAPTFALPSYEDPRWDRLFAVCAERNMVLNTHIGAGELSLFAAYRGPAYAPTFMMESPWLGRRAMWLLSFTGAFDRHPDLKLVLTELPGAWWDLTVREMDAAYYNERARRLRAHIKHKPSDYVRHNMYMGASFQSREEAEMAVSTGWDDRVMWGSDFPHVEGTWVYPDDPGQPSVSRLSLANTFHGLPEASVRRMCGENAIECYGLDREALAAIATRIGPSSAELDTAPDLSLVPDYYRGSGFRTHGGFS